METKPPNMRETVSGITAGLVVGLIFILASISLSTLIFNGDLRVYLSRGVGLFLFSGFTLSIIHALFGKFHGITIAPQDGPAVLVSVTAGGIAGSLIGKENQDSVFYTVTAAIILGSLVTGICFFLIGQFKLGNLVRYIPYPVVGGFLAGTGWLLTRGAMEVMIGEALNINVLSNLLQPQYLVRWLPGTIFAIIVLIVVRRSSHFLIWPGVVASSVLIFYTALTITGTSIEQARSAGLLLAPFPSGGLWAPYMISGFSQINWQILAAHADKLIPIPLLSMIGLLLNATGLELIAKRDIDLNHELRITGLANILAGLGGGPVGYHQLGTTSLAHGMGARSRVVTITTALICGTVLVVGGGFVSYLPVALLSSLLLILGLSFLMDWVYEAYFKLPITDYAVVLISLFVIAYIGFLQGVVVGFFAATILFVFKYSRVNAVRDALNGTIYHAKVDRPALQRNILHNHGDNIHIFRLQGYIFFGTSDKLVTRMRELLSSSIERKRYILMDFHRVYGLDSSAVSSFTRMRQLANQYNAQLVLTQVLPSIIEQMALGDFKADDRTHFFPTLDHGMEWCENMLLENFHASTQFIRAGIRSQLRETFPRPDLIDKLMAYLERMEVDEHQYLMRRGEIPDSMYFIESGRLNVQIESESGDVNRIRNMRSGTVVGELGLYLKSERTANVITEQKSVLYRLKLESVKEMEANDPDLASALHEWIARLLAERMADNNRAIEALLD